MYYTISSSSPVSDRYASTISTRSQSSSDTPRSSTKPCLLLSIRETNDIWTIIDSKYDQSKYPVEKSSPEAVKAHLKRLKKEAYWKDVIKSDKNKTGYRIDFEGSKTDAANEPDLSDNEPLQEVSTSKPEPSNKIMTIQNSDGTTEDVEVILAFEFKDTKLEYVIYTKNEKDFEGNVTVYVSYVDRSSGEPKLVGIEDEEEWKKVRKVLYELAESKADQDNPTYSYDGRELI